MLINYLTVELQFFIDLPLELEEKYVILTKPRAGIKFNLFRIDIIVLYYKLLCSCIDVITFSLIIYSGT